MSKKKTQMEKTSADSILVAFDYQYYFFLWKLLSLRAGESVGLEVKDDVHTELNNNEQILYQVKHSVKTKSDNTPVNLTESDIDLWKTLSNWSEIVTDKNDNRTTIHNQLLFIKKTTFVLASNKSLTKTNEILDGIINYQNNTIDLKKIKEIFETLQSKSENDSLVKYIHNILKLEPSVLKEFLVKISFELDEDEIIEKCKAAIKADKIPESKIDEVFSNIDSAIRANNFIEIKKGHKIQKTFDDYYLKYRRHYDLARNDSLQIQEFAGTLPSNLEAQVFIQQLIELGDVEESDLEEITEFTIFKLKLQNNINIWIQNGEITDAEINRFKKDATDQWKNKHRSAFRNIASNLDFNKIGLDVLDFMRDKKLTISGQSLDVDISNGTFYYLSDVPDIGWRKDWEKYKQ